MADESKKQKGHITGFIQLIAVVIFVVISFMASSALKYNENARQGTNADPRVLNVETQIITPANHTVSFPITGVIESRATIEIVPQVSGDIISISEAFFAGGAFAANEVLFQINPLDYELEVQRLDAEVARAQTALDLEQAESNAAIKEWKQLRGSKRAVPDLVARKPQLSEATANLKAAQALLKNAQLDLDRTQFSLPFSGQVLTGGLSVGRYVSAGQSYGTVFDQNALEVKTSLNAQQLEWLKNGNPASIPLMINHNNVATLFDGYLKRGASNLNAQTRFATVSLGIRGDVLNLMPGQFVNATITGPEQSNIAIVPLNAYQKNQSLWVVFDDDTLSTFQPDILYMNDDVLAVTNMTEPMKIVTSRLDGGVEGMSVATTPAEGNDE